MKRLIFQAALIFTAAATLCGQSSQQIDLLKLEKVVATQFNDLRMKAGLKPLRFRQDVRMRMEACSVQINGPDPFVEHARNMFWYHSADPNKLNSELDRLAGQKITYDHVAVGIWFARTEAYPSGMYWVVVSTEHSAAHETFWSHFYLSDDFEYQTILDKNWKQRLPQLCRTIS